MPFLVIPVTMYVVYKHQQASELGQMDPEIDLEGKTAVRFLPMEVEKAGMLENPINSISFFNGNYKLIAPRLKERIDAIISANPWLGGVIANISGTSDGGHFRLFYDASGITRAPGSFTVFEPGEVPLNGRTTPYSDYETIFEEAALKVKRNRQQVGRNSSLWRISIIPDPEEPEERFGLVMSMSHLIGDGHVFYKLYMMLSNEADIETLNPVRLFDALDAGRQLLGKEEYHYITKAVSNPMWEWTQSEECNNCVFIISKYWLEFLRLEHNTKEGKEDTLEISDNSIITWWFFNVTKPTVGFMSYNLRNRIQDCGLNDLTAGNYSNPIPYTSIDYATPELIQKSLKTAVRCGSDPPAPLPGFQWDATFSLITNWATFYKRSIRLGEDVEEILHMPLQDASEMKLIPSKLTLMCLFSAREGRLGAFISAPKSIMAEVEVSGIMDEVITKF